MADKKELPPILKEGYGFSPKKIMRDPSLKVEAKAIYCYLASFAGTQAVAFPSVELICHELDISENRFHKYKNELVKHGYITIERQRLESGFSKNIYLLNGYSVSLQNEGIGNVGIGNVAIGNEVTNSNSLESNSFKSNNPKKNSTASQEKHDSYSTLTSAGHPLLDYYNQKFKEKFGKNHPPVVKTKLPYIADEIDNCEWEYGSIEHELLPTLIDRYFETLPSGNDGKVYGFLHDGVRMRLTETLEHADE